MRGRGSRTDFVVSDGRKLRRLRRAAYAPLNPTQESGRLSPGLELAWMHTNRQEPGVVGMVRGNLTGGHELLGEDAAGGRRRGFDVATMVATGETRDPTKSSPVVPRQCSVLLKISAFSPDLRARRARESTQLSLSPTWTIPHKYSTPRSSARAPFPRRPPGTTPGRQKLAASRPTITASAASSTRRATGDGAVAPGSASPARQSRLLDPAWLTVAVHEDVGFAKSVDGREPVTERGERETARPADRWIRGAWRRAAARHALSGLGALATWGEALRHGRPRRCRVPSGWPILAWLPHTGREY